MLSVSLTCDGMRTERRAANPKAGSLLEPAAKSFARAPRGTSTWVFVMLSVSLICHGTRERRAANPKARSLSEPAPKSGARAPPGTLFGTVRSSGGPLPPPMLGSASSSGIMASETMRGPARQQATHYVETDENDESGRADYGDPLLWERSPLGSTFSDSSTPEDQLQEETRPTPTREEDSSRRQLFQESEVTSTASGADSGAVSSRFGRSGAQIFEHEDPPAEECQPGAESEGFEPEPEPQNTPPRKRRRTESPDPGEFSEQSQAINAPDAAHASGASSSSMTSASANPLQPPAKPMPRAPEQVLRMTFAEFVALPLEQQQRWYEEIRACHALENITNFQ